MFFQTPKNTAFTVLNQILIKHFTKNVVMSGYVLVMFFFYHFKARKPAPALVLLRFTLHLVMLVMFFLTLSFFLKKPTNHFTCFLPQSIHFFPNKPPKPRKRGGVSMARGGLAVVMAALTRRGAGFCAARWADWGIDRSSSHDDVPRPIRIHPQHHPISEA